MITQLDDAIMRICEMDDKEREILEYCKPHLKYMWASKIASIILDCDFREVKDEINKTQEK